MGRDTGKGRRGNDEHTIQHEKGRADAGSGRLLAVTAAECACTATPPSAFRVTAYLRCESEVLVISRKSVWQTCPQQSRHTPFRQGIRLRLGSKWDAARCRRCSHETGRAPERAIGCRAREWRSTASDCCGDARTINRWRVAPASDGRELCAGCLGACRARTQCPSHLSGQLRLRCTE